MAQGGPPRVLVCATAALAEGEYRKLRLVFEKRDEECVVLRFEGAVYAYINRCVHMPRRLDCERKHVFDDSGRFLRCSMHGIVYQPQTGASLSTMCEGERLRAVEVYEEGGEIGLADFRITAAEAIPL